MSLQGLNELRETFVLRNTLTINADVEVLGDLNTTGFIYDGGVPVNIQGNNNVWTGENDFTLSQPTFLDPVADDEMATKNYLDGAVVGLGDAFLPLDNTWLGDNSFSVLPVISNNATAATSQLVNKGVVDGYIGASTGSLGTANVWTGTASFANKMIVPTPVGDSEFGNKKYVDDAITAFNASGGKIDYVESAVEGGQYFTCDPAIYSGCIFCVVSSGGFGYTGALPVASGASLKVFGGSGAYACFKVPAYAGNVVWYNTNNTSSAVGNCSFTLPNGSEIINVFGGQNATNVSGAGGLFGVGNGFAGIQLVNGSTEPTQNPITNDAINKSFNVGVLNGRGMGGSFNYTSGVNVNPSGGYCLQIKFKN